MRERSAGGVVLRRMRGGAYVAAIRPAGRPAGHWALPKGLVEDGEDPLASAVREVWEETGLRVAPIETKAQAHLRYVYTRGGQRIFKLVSFWLMRPLGGRIGAIPPGMEREVADVRWLRLDAAPSLLAYRGEQQIVARLVGGSSPLDDPR